MDDYQRIPSRVIGLNDTINYNRQDGQTALPTNQHHIMLQPPPLLIHTVPSYVSNRSVSNRSVSNRSVSNRSVSNRSVTTSATRGRIPRNTATEGAERIAIATAQARAAAHSILLTGGSQAAALSTAKAAAKSVLLPVKEDSRGKPPMGSTLNNNFRNRRKNLQQAEIIASMALVSANETLEYGTMGNDMMTMTPGGLRSAYQDERDSEFPDDYTNYRSLAPSIYGRTHSVRSHKEMQNLRYPEYYEQSRQGKQTLHPMKAIEQEIAAPSKTLQDQSMADQQTLDSKIYDNSISLKSDKPQSLNMNLTKLPSVKGLFQGIQGPAKSENVEQTEPMEKVPRTKIPMEMPMPRSNPIKVLAPLKPDHGGKQQHAKADRNSTPRSRQQLSESQISCYSDHSSVSHTNSYSSTYDEHTADYTRGTFESVVDSTTRRKSSYLNRSSGASFFSTMDPFVRTFSEVFSCSPVPVQHIQKNQSKSDILNRRLKIRESRDSAGISQYNSIQFVEEAREQPPPQGQAIINLSAAAPRRSTSVDESILSINDMHTLVDHGTEAKSKEPSNNKKKITSPTMEQLVLRALSAISPKGAASKRPRLNIKPLKQSGGPVMTAAKSTKYRSFNDGNGKIEVNGAVNNKRPRKDAVKVFSRTSAKPSKNGSESVNGGALTSIKSHSSGNNHPQQQQNQQQSSSSSSCEYYISASTDDSANMTSAAEPPILQGPTMHNSTMKQNNVALNNLDSKTKRFPTFSFHRHKRVTRGDQVE